MINVYQPTLGEEELDAVRQVFQSNWIGKGKKVDELETRLADQIRVNALKVLTTTSCTQGLFLILDHLGLGPGDEVVLPTVSFVGAANAVAARGARPVFADVDPSTLNVRADDLEKVLSPKTRAVIVLHYGGWPNTQIWKIMGLCDDYGLTLIEDNACSPFTEYDGEPCGAFGDFGVWSFDAMKILCAGDGAAIFCKYIEAAEALRKKAYLGLDRGSGLTSNQDRWWEFDTDGVSGRHIMNDITAAIAVEQLKKVPSFLARRKEIYQRYQEAFIDCGWFSIHDGCYGFPGVVSSYYQYWIQLNYAPDRDHLARHLKDLGIYTNFRYYPLHLTSGYGYQDPTRFPGAASAAHRTLNLPLHQGLTDADVSHVIESVISFKQ